MTRPEGISVLSAICDDLGALGCVLPAARAGRPAPTAHAKRFSVSAAVWAARWVYVETVMID